MSIQRYDGTSLTVPTVHLNGTSRESLIAALVAASEALDVAYEKLKQTAPNGRDYYPQGGLAFPLASGQHLDRLGRLDSVKWEIDQLIAAVDAGGLLRREPCPATAGRETLCPPDELPWPDRCRDTMKAIRWLVDEGLRLGSVMEPTTALSQIRKAVDAWFARPVSKEQSHG